jgi:hypothetical protein
VSSEYVGRRSAIEAIDGIGGIIIQSPSENCYWARVRR